MPSKLVIAMGNVKPERELPPRPGASAPEMNDNPKEEREEKQGVHHVSPEAVSYRTGDQKCSTCEYMGESGMCSVIGMDVEPEASCNAFEAREGGTGEESADTAPARGMEGFQ